MAYSMTTRKIHTQPGAVRALFLLCWASYFLCYIGKLNYSAAMAEMIGRGVLQPGVENVFMYAIPEAEQTVSIRLTARMRPGGLEIKVLDNGPGMSAERLARVRRQVRTGETDPTPEEEALRKRRSTGIGLHNINARLKLYMGLEEALYIYSKKGVGTKVIIWIPLQGGPQQGSP